MASCSPHWAWQDRSSGHACPHGPPEDLLMALFAGLLLAVATIMALKMRSPAPVGAGERGWTVRTLAATAVGLLTGFFGIGGGFVVVPALTHVVGLSMSQAVGTSLLVIAINSAVALAGRAAHGLDVDWTSSAPSRWPRSSARSWAGACRAISTSGDCGLASSQCSCSSAWPLQPSTCRSS
ncbi:TSUP family transporter [Luteococcus sediminum]